MSTNNIIVDDTPLAGFSVYSVFVCETLCTCESLPLGASSYLCIVCVQVNSLFLMNHNTTSVNTCLDTQVHTQLHIGENLSFCQLVLPALMRVESVTDLRPEGHCRLEGLNVISSILRSDHVTVYYVLKQCVGYHIIVQCDKMCFSAFSYRTISC